MIAAEWLQSVCVCWRFLPVLCLILVSHIVCISAINTSGISMAFLLNFFKKVWNFEEQEPEEPVPKYDFPDTFEGFGYYFNEQGELRDKTGGKFVFNVKDKDHNYNQQRYDALGELVTEYLYEKMEKELHMQRVYIPLDARKGEAQSFVFLTRNAMENRDKLMILIHGGGAVRAGQWSRKLVINENIETGSQLPYIQRALKDGYDVIVCNPNLNQVLINGKLQNVKGNKSPEEHGTYIWQYFIRQAKAQNIAIVAHSYGGIVTMHMIERYLEEMKPRVFAICFTDSVHTMQRHLWTSSAKAFIKERAVNFGASYVPLNTQLQISDPDDCASVSAGTQEHDRTSHTAIDLVFKFIKDNYITWTRSHTFAARHFLPLPEDLTPYQPSNKWNLKKKEAEVKVVNEAEGEGIKKDATTRPEDRKSSSVDQAASNAEEAMPLKADEKPEKAEWASEEAKRASEKAEEASEKSAAEVSAKPEEVSKGKVAEVSEKIKEVSANTAEVSGKTEEVPEKAEEALEQAAEPQESKAAAAEEDNDQRPDGDGDGKDIATGMTVETKAESDSIETGLVESEEDKLAEVTKPDVGGGDDGDGDAGAAEVKPDSSEKPEGGQAAKDLKSEL